MSVDAMIKRQDGDGSVDGYTASITAKMIIHELNKIETLVIVFAVLITLSMLIRVYVRLAMTRIWGREDWAMVVTYLFSMTQSILSAVISETGKQLWSGNAGVAKLNDHMSRVSYGFYALTLIALKFSLGFFFLRIFSHKKIQRTIIYVTLGLHTLSGLTYFAFPVFTCVQLKALQGLTDSCALQSTSTAIFTIFSLMNILSDFIFTTMAVTALWKAKLPVPTKISACALVLIGCVGGVASIIRLAYVLQPTDPLRYTQQLFDLARWVIIELAAGILAANLAMIRPLLHDFLVRFKIISTQGTTEPSRHTGNRTAQRQVHTDRNGDTFPLNEIKRGVEVIVDAEKGSDEYLDTRIAVRQREI
ncbi:hypothetical protein BDZ85DRAFT_279104 [Elsinoe ampelina]|uniref:Rhodopsin domain-containing protein n=1 Tax=Elsinoe ampelina TaxID=302913 RepID=A0A6A6GI83_9PEZI|nr:hypothetical protein BDZ85DRAFT_279104 [Elsinoe ampelina]